MYSEYGLKTKYLSTKGSLCVTESSRRKTLFTIHEFRGVLKRTMFFFLCHIVPHWISLNRSMLITLLISDFRLLLTNASLGVLHGYIFHGIPLHHTNYFMKLLYYHQFLFLYFQQDSSKLHARKISNAKRQWPIRQTHQGLLMLKLLSYSPGRLIKMPFEKKELMSIKEWKIDSSDRLVMHCTYQTSF